MDIALQQTGKRFNRTWIFRDLNLQIPAGSHLAILGANGSGKSTLLQVLSGYVNPSEGQVIFQHHGQTIATEKIYRHISMATPYLDLHENLSLRETLEFHSKFRPFVGDMNLDTVLDRLFLKEHSDKLIRHFSSGMKQRLKLGLAFMTESSLVLLDEPLSNLDQSACEWYQNLLDEFIGQRSLIVCSNHQQTEYASCTAHLELQGNKRPMNQ